jgi:regulator of replication initiation timing
MGIRGRIEADVKRGGIVMNTDMLVEYNQVLIEENRRLRDEVERLQTALADISDTVTAQVSAYYQMEIRRLRGALEKIENLARHHTDNPDWLRKEIVVRVRKALKGGDSE